MKYLLSILIIKLLLPVSIASADSSIQCEEPQYSYGCACMEGGPAFYKAYYVRMNIETGELERVRPLLQWSYYDLDQCEEEMENELVCRL